MTKLTLDLDVPDDLAAQVAELPREDVIAALADAVASKDALAFESDADEADAARVCEDRIGDLDRGDHGILLSDYIAQVHAQRAREDAALSTTTAKSAAAQRDRAA